MTKIKRHMWIYLIGFLLASKVVASMLPGVQPKTRNILLQLKTPGNGSVNRQDFCKMTHAVNNG
jgi:hypothetical protein